MSIELAATLRLTDHTGNVSHFPFPITPGASALPPDGPWEHWHHRPTWRYLDRYATWRRTKTRPVEPGSALAHFEDMNQATHEFIGEVGEAAQMLIEGGVDCFRFGPMRTKFIGEIGDIFFTGSWLGDAWGLNPAIDNPDARTGDNYLDPVIESDARALGRAIQAQADNLKYDAEPYIVLFTQALYAASEAALLSNMYKKLRYQGRMQDPRQAYGHIRVVLQWAARMGVVGNFSVADALDANITKLDARYPAGYQLGSGGGIRTGVGA